MLNSSSQFETRALSRQQMLMWMGQQLDPDSPIYNMAFRIELKGDLDLKKFEFAYQNVVRRSNSLRSTIHNVEGVPGFRIHPEIDFEVPTVDLSSASSPRQSAVDWCNERCRQKFHLSKRMFDSAILKLADDEFVWYFNHHHLISDAWAGTQLLRHVSEAYTSQVEVDTPLADEFCFAADAEHVGQAQFSKPLIPLKLYGKESPGNSSASTRDTVISGEDPLMASILNMAKHPAARSFSAELGQMNVVLAALFAYLYRVSGRNELTVGVPFHNRLTPESRTTLGSMIELYPVTVAIADEETFESLLKQVKVAVNDFLRKATSKVPTEKGSGQYNVVLNFIHAQFGEFANQPVLPTWLHPGCSDRQHDLWLHFENFSARSLPLLSADFSHEVFRSTCRQRATRHIRAIFEAMISDVQREISSVDLLESAELEQVVSLESGEDVPLGSLVVERVRQAFHASRDSTAVIAQGNHHSYAELEQHIASIQTLLLKADIHQGSRVAIALPRSFDAVASFFALLGCGYSFVPVDPAWPESRIDFVLQDSQAAALIVDSSFSKTLKVAPKRLVIDAMMEAGLAAARFNLAAPEETAYILYTSGSTGQPKGVEISHGSLAHYVNWAADYYGQGQPLSFPLFTPMTFDLTLTSIFVPLATGGRVVVYPESSSGTDVALLEVLSDDLCDVVKLTPSHLSLLEGQSFNDSKVTQLILGGENLKSKVAQAIFKKFADGLKIHNEYGPTEATVGCIVHTIDAKTMANGVSVPIGKPIPRMRAFILNQSQLRQPVGVVGELFLGGAGLAKGYFGNQAMTASRFLESHPFESECERLYRTGDLARIGSNGVIEYVGRVDQQVKIRGARIELGAVEAAVLSHEAITSAVATTYSLQEDIQAQDGSEQRIVAYYCSDNDVEKASLDSHLKSTLPAFMVPSRYIRMDSIPMTANGKADLASLPDPTETESQRATEFVAATGEVETQLVKIWQDVLRVPKVGVDDNFFDLGGDSILAIQIVARAYRAGLILTPLELFNNQSVRLLAKIIGSKCIRDNVDLRPQTDLAPIQKWALDHELKGSDYWVQMISIRLPEDVHAENLCKALAFVVNEHDSLRTKVDVETGELVGLGELAAERLSVESVDTASEATAETELCRRLAFHSEELMAAVLVKGEPPRLTMAADHMAVDAVSWRQIIDDLKEAYLCLENESTIPSRSVTSFASWANYLITEGIEQFQSQQDYWEQVISSKPPVPHGVSTSANTFAEVSSISKRVGGLVDSRLAERIRKARISVHELLLSALSKALGAWAATEDMRILVERHGREPLSEEIDNSLTVGWFTTLVPTRIELPVDKSPGSLLSFVKDQLRAIPDNGIGYGVLAFLSEDEASKGRLKLGNNEVVFNYLGKTNIEANEAFEIVKPLRLFRSEEQKRTSLVDMNVSLADQLEIECEYDAKKLNRSDVERLLDNFCEQIRLLVTYCIEDGAGQASTSDFKLANLNSDQLSNLASLLNRKGNKGDNRQ